MAFLNDPQCEASYGGFRCKHPAGHVGRHNNYDQWPGPQEPEMVTRDTMCRAPFGSYGCGRDKGHLGLHTSIYSRHKVWDENGWAHHPSESPLCSSVLRDTQDPKGVTVIPCALDEGHVVMHTNASRNMGWLDMDAVGRGMALPRRAPRTVAERRKRRH